MSALVSWVLALLGLAAGAGILLVIIYLFATLVANVVARSQHGHQQKPNRG
jgi:hypothetical protein